MSGYGIGDFAAVAVDREVGHRRVLTAAGRRREVVEADEELVGFVEAVGERPAGAAYLSHRHRGVDPPADDVADRKPHSLLEVDDVVPIAADEPGRRRRVVRPPWGLGCIARRNRHHPPLQLEGDLVVDVVATGALERGRTHHDHGIDELPIDTLERSLRSRGDDQRATHLASPHDRMGDERPHAEHGTGFVTDRPTELVELRQFERRVGLEQIVDAVGNRAEGA